MALLLNDHNVIILHPPRTGGTWAERALTKVGLDPQPIGLKHAHLSCGGDPFNIVRDRNAFTMAFVRNPVDWYISHWSFRISMNSRLLCGEYEWPPFEPDAMWHPTWDVDAQCGSPDFLIFVERCLELFPAFLTHLFNLYVKVPPVDEVDVIVKTETLESDLAKGLVDAGVDFDEKSLRSTEETNRSSPEIRNNAKFTPKILDALLKSERRALGRFGYSMNSEYYDDYIAKD